MQGELAQIISLTSYGSDFIKTGELVENYFPNNTTFQFCNLVDFRDFKRKWFNSKLAETVSAENPVVWFHNLRSEGCTKIRLYYKSSTDKTFGPEYNLAGFAGGAGTWLIETIFEGYSYYWQKRWLVTNKNAVDKKIWAVSYARTVKKAITTNQQFDIALITNQFTKVLTELIVFCSDQNLTYWRETFEKASNILSSTIPNKEYYHHDLIVPKNYSLAAQQLLFSVGQSWVFGGMGSWNDMGFENKEVNETYLQLSQRLYELLLQGIIGATNSF